MAYLLLVEADTLGAGKTSQAAWASQVLAQRGFRVGGLLCRAVYKPVGDGFAWIGQDAHLLPGNTRFPLGRVDHPGWEPRETFPEHERQHPRLTPERRRHHINPVAAGRCLDHLLQVIRDPAIDAVVFDEVGTILGGPMVGNRDERMMEADRKSTRLN